jgi:non-homologous end joining protein Ku
VYDGSFRGRGLENKKRFSETTRSQNGNAEMRKLIAFDDDTFDKLKQLARDRMGTFQELADEAFADLLKKHGIPIDLKDALRKSARLAQEPDKKSKGPKASQKAKS